MSLNGAGNNSGSSALPLSEGLIFALDIGTRTVIGIVAGMEGKNLRVLAQSMTEHESRAVFDGQIHDIFRVAQAVKKVKGDLEDKMGFKLGRVAIAAAGRSLKTRFVRMDQEIGDDIEIDPVICRGLEMDAVREAHRQLQEEGAGGGEEEYFCVGYTVVNYYLNGYSITSLAGHTGKRAGVEVLATFLPNSVVNSLYAVLGRVGLEPASLTLEPIAASKAIIPDSYRLLNIALLDIGAGTSDIAITRDGAIVAYGMVPLAGDEITEALAQGCLADFNTAESIKRELVKGKEITFRDIMGVERTISPAGALEILDPVLESLTGRVTEEILMLNGNKPPKAVFCVGGGGQVPTFTDRVAGKLNLPPDRVGLRDRSSIPGLQGGDLEISGPEGVTVVGIARVAMENVGHNFIAININGKDYRLFHSRELTVFDALGLIEYNPGDLVGKNGRDLRFVLNGERKVVYGGLCKAARVILNGEPANLKTILSDGDALVIEKARRGEDARAVIGDFLGEFPEVTLRISGRLEKVGPRCFINGRPAGPHSEIAEGDRVEIRPVVNVGHLAGARGMDPAGFEALVNGRKVSGDYVLGGGDSVEFLRTDPAGGVNVQGAAREEAVEVTVNGRKIRLSGKPDYIFLDIFKHVSVDMAGGFSGGRIKLLLNGCNASYVDPIKDGDVIEVGWN